MTLRQTAFKDRIASMGATFDEYAGYEFAYRYGDDILAEYWACRRRAAVLDLTPLRKVEVSGPGTRASSATSCGVIPMTAPRSGTPCSRRASHSESVRSGSMPSTPCG